MRKLSVKWFPKCLNADQKRQRCHSSEQLLDIFRRDPNDFLSRLVIVDETWLYHYDPETKQQTMEWRHSGSHRPKKIPSAKICWKFLPSIFWHQDSILITDFLPKGTIINEEYYSFLLVQLKDILKEKRREGRSPSGSCSCMTMPRLTGHLQPRRNLPTLTSNVLITHSILRTWPRRRQIGR